ncbi:hypothetical protein [Sphingobacterium sp. 1.A.4]|uniref:hypothetical protein n=1 Tax=Sphingobacterium sp. 1.A.4 TaxID=2044603 RepID=UPI0015D4BBA4|nr:hypothetical protein [Sphingobacterium sp. 1.A.4]
MNYQQRCSLIKNICHFNDDDDVGVDGAENYLYNDDKYDGQQQKLGISIWQRGKSALSN